MKKVLLFIITILVVLTLCFSAYLWLSDCGVSPFRCGDYPSPDNIVTQQISVGSGPEDMAIDNSQGNPRIIVSCDARRESEGKSGGFYAIDISTNESYELNIEPANFEIYPHGIDIVTMDSITYLYAISHHEEDDSWRHPVFRFEIRGNTLVLDESQILEDPLMNVPNDLDVLSDGSFYASNYVPSMDPNESTKAILGIKNGSIVHYDGRGNWQIAAKDFCYPNGIWGNEQSNKIYVANGACHEVVSFDIQEGKIDEDSKQSTLQHKEKITIGDNLMFDNQGRLWVTAHPCPLDFLAHADDGKADSPIQIYTMDPETLEAKNAFQNNGELISAASTALFIDNRLYISQVFDPYVLVVEGLNLN